MSEDTLCILFKTIIIINTIKIIIITIIIIVIIIFIIKNITPTISSNKIEAEHLLKVVYIYIYKFTYIAPA